MSRTAEVEEVEVDESMVEEHYESIEKLQEFGVNATDIKKLKEHGLHTTAAVLMHTKSVKQNMPNTVGTALHRGFMS